MVRKIVSAVIVAIAMTTLVSCAGSTIFPTLTDQIAGVAGIAVDADNNRLYLVNANEKVAYNWEQGSFQVYDITNPLAPVLMRTTETLSASGQVSLDLVRKRAYVTNRFSANDGVNNDRMYIFNIDETSADFMTFTEIELGLDPYGIACCYPTDRMWVAEGGKDETYYTQYVDRGTLAVGNINMLVDLENGGRFTENETTEVAIYGNQAFLSRIRGGVVVLNLDEVGVAGAEPVDYWIQDIASPRGITTDGTYIYVVSEENDSGSWVPWVHVLDPTATPPLTNNTGAVVLDKNDDGVLVTSIGLNSRRDPQDILLTNDYIFVTVSWNDDQFVEVLNRGAWTWNREIATGEEPFVMALYAPGGVEQYVYVVNQIDNTIQVIDIATLAIVATYP